MTLANHLAGAKLGAIRFGSQRTAVDSGGNESRSFWHVWTFLDALGRRLEIYGSGGWGFESSRARLWILQRTTRS